MKANKLRILAALVVFLAQQNLYCGLALTSSHISRHHRTTSHSSKSKHREEHHLSSHKHGRTQIARSAGRGRHKHVAAKTRYAYPVGIFLYQPPAFEATSLPEEEAAKIRKAFMQGTAGDYPTRSLVRAKLVTYYPIRGGVFFRREPIKNLIMHSTEPGRPISAQAVIDGWSHLGRRHPGAHYVVDRDGTIYQAIDPDLAAVHINIFKTLPGFDNDNSVGIEMNHQGGQNYPPQQLQSVVRLAVYLQSHYHIPDRNVVTHRYAQQGDHTDPVNFSWDSFIADKTSLQNQALNCRLAELKTEAIAWHPIEGTPGKAKIFKGNKPEFVELAKPKTESLAVQQPVIDNQPTISATKVAEPEGSAPIPTSAGANLVSDTNASRLIPVASGHRLLPASMVINHNNVQEFKSFDTAEAPVPSLNNRSKKILPLKGPIEMDPNEAAGLLNQ